MIVENNSPAASIRITYARRRPRQGPGAYSPPVRSCPILSAVTAARIALVLFHGVRYAAHVTTGPARALLRRLGQFLDGFSACFSRQPQREAATRYIDGLFSDSERKSMQAMHGRLGEECRTAR